jgi:TM2 domain-containing membrane protein YozV
MQTTTLQLLSELPTKQSMIAMKQIEDNSLKVSTAYILLIVGSLFWLHGLHHFYRGRLLIGFLYLFTLGFLGIGSLLDLFAIPTYVKDHNAKVEREVCAVFAKDE